MEKMYLNLASRIISVQAMHESTRDFCREYLCDGAADFAVEVGQEDILFEREKSAREDWVEGKPVRQYSDAYLETIALQRKIAERLFEHDTLLFHGSVVAVDGVGYLFTAKSGTGKSTHTRLWRQALGDRAVMVNDDKPFLRITRDGVLAYGTPWQGKHRLGSNMCVPLKSICILQRGVENAIRPIPAKDAVMMLLQQSNRPMQPQLLPKYMELVDALSQRVEFYQMQCNMDPQAAVMAYDAMRGDRKEDLDT